MKHRRILHIGQRKTGTTWLQFGAQRAAEAGLLTFQYWDIARWSGRVTRRSATAEDYEALAALLPMDQERPVFATCEGLIVHDPARLAAAIQTAWPDAHVLVTTRAPQDYLLSSFNNASMSGHGDPSDFATRFARRHMSRSHDLDGVAKEFGDLFTPDRVHFLLYELLRDDQPAYVQKLKALFGLPMEIFLPEEKLNASPPAAYLVLARRLNALVDARAPDILESDEWSNFMRMANFSAGAAKGLDQYFHDYFQGGFRVSDAMPRLDEQASAFIAGRMKVLSDLPHYRPYLSRYGLLLGGSQAGGSTVEAGNEGAVSAN